MLIKSNDNSYLIRKLLRFTFLFLSHTIFFFPFYRGLQLLIHLQSAKLFSWAIMIPKLHSLIISLSIFGPFLYKKIILDKQVFFFVNLTPSSKNKKLIHFYNSRIKYKAGNSICNLLYSL